MTARPPTLNANKHAQQNTTTVLEETTTTFSTQTTLNVLPITLAAWVSSQKMRPLPLSPQLSHHTQHTALLQPLSTTMVRDTSQMAQLS